MEENIDPKHTALLIVDIQNEFLAKMINAGYTKAQIKEKLIAAGWPKDFIDKWCDRFFEKDTTKIETAQKSVSGLNKKRLKIGKKS